jgi:hypothetical protein
LVQFAEPLAELALRENGLPLALFFSADSQVQGYWHGWITRAGASRKPRGHDIPHSTDRKMQVSEFY